MRSRAKKKRKRREKESMIQVAVVRQKKLGSERSKRKMKTSGDAYRREKYDCNGKRRHQNPSFNSGL